MRRWALPLAIAALLALAGLLLVEVLRPVPGPTRADEERQITAELRCPDCQALSVAESQTAAAVEIRRQVAEQLAAGRTPAQVRAYFVARYGEWILLEPTSPVAWWAPPLVVLAGIAVLGWWLVRGRRGSASPSAPSPPVGAIAEQIRDEMEQLDA